MPIPFWVRLFMLVAMGWGCQAPPSSSKVIPADHPNIRYTGRFDFSKSGAPRFAYSGSQIEFVFEGRSCGIFLSNFSEAIDPLGNLMGSHYRVQIDEREPFVLVTDNEKDFYSLAEGLPEGPHRVQLFKRTEAQSGVGEFRGIQVSGSSELLPLPARPARRIEFIGNSITAGYGNLEDRPDCPFTCATEDHYLSFAALTARNRQAEHHAICFSGRGVYQNYDRSRAGSMTDLYAFCFPQDSTLWDFSSWVPDWVVINLGTNDFAHFNPDSAAFCAAYLRLLGQVRGHYPQARIVCLTGPMMADFDSRKPLSTLKRYLRGVMEKWEDAYTYRFDLTTQGPLGFGCGWHPNRPQHELNAKELTEFLREMEKKRDSE